MSSSNTDKKAKLKEEKELILRQLARHAKFSPSIQALVPNVPDSGSEIDDDVHEIEEHDVIEATIRILLGRLNAIDEELSQNN